jgi:hypothetical protein
LSILHIKPDTERRIRLIGYTLEILKYLREEPNGYELAVRQILGDFLLLLSVRKRNSVRYMEENNRKDSLKKASA